MEDSLEQGSLPSKVRLPYGSCNQDYMLSKSLLNVCFLENFFFE